MVAPRAKSVCSFVSLVQTNLGTKSVCNVTKRSNVFGYTNLDHSRPHKIEKKQKQNGSGPFPYKFFVPIRVGLTTEIKFKDCGKRASVFILRLTIHLRCPSITLRSHSWPTGVVFAP